MKRNVFNASVCTVTPAVVRAYQWSCALCLLLQRILPVQAQVFKSAQLSIEVLHHHVGAADSAAHKGIVFAKQHARGHELPQWPH